MKTKGTINQNAFTLSFILIKNISKEAEEIYRQGYSPTLTATVAILLQKIKLVQQLIRKLNYS